MKLGLQIETAQQYESSRLYEWGRRAFVLPVPNFEKLIKSEKRLECARY
jgi:hypothetical protein